MCGIFGVFDRDKINMKSFNKALLKIKHRGPDNQSSILINNNVSFGHVRLSILDLTSKNNQPFEFQDRYFLTYNGEIFNYIEIREALIKKGYKFKTSGDTEVLLYSYIEWGENCVEKFNGMWSFALFDKKDNKLFCSRDRYGIKPLYFYQKEVAADPDFVEKHRDDICASIQYTIINILMDKIKKAVKQTGIKRVAIGGGVSANSGIRKALKDAEAKYGWKTFVPKFEYTTDNAAMIGIVGYLKYKDENLQGSGYVETQAKAQSRLKF